MEEFKQAFSDGYNAYINGDWADAKEFFDQAEVQEPGDGPTRSLLSYIEMNQCKKPEEWAGYRMIEM